MLVSLLLIKYDPELTTEIGREVAERIKEKGESMQSVEEVAQ